MTIFVFHKKNNSSSKMFVVKRKVFYVTLRFSHHSMNPWKCVCVYTQKEDIQKCQDAAGNLKKKSYLWENSSYWIFNGMFAKKILK